MTQRLAQLLSVVLHPLLIPSLSFYIFLYVSPLPSLALSYDVKGRLLWVIFILTFLAPLAGILLFFATGGLKDWELKDPSERQIPYLLTTVFYTIGTFFFALSEGYRDYPILAIVVGSIALTLALVSLINLYWKISAHSVGISGLVGFMLGIIFKYSEDQLFYPFLLALVAAGALMSARLYLNHHSPNQVMAGSALGFSISLVATLVFL